MASIATNRYVERPGLVDFVRPCHSGVLLTTRRDSRPQASLVTMGLSLDGHILIATYPERAKVCNLRRNPLSSVVVMSDSFNGEWVQVDGQAEIVDLPEAVDGLVAYFRSISGEHPNWEEYRKAMVTQEKCLIRFSIESWGPIAKGGFPPRFA